MSTQSQTKIIAFVGMAGSGKSTAVDYITEKGYPRVYFGGVIYDAMRHAGIEITPESQTAFREEIRKREGDDFVVKRIIDQIRKLEEAGQHRIVADGIYSWTEYKTMKHAFHNQLSVVAVVVPKQVRHKRLAVRPDRPFTELESTERDWTEIEHLEKGGPIAMADYFIQNSDDIDHYIHQVDDILKAIDF